MAATDTPTTLSELQTALLNLVKEPTGNTALNTVATRYLNQANQDLHGERWWWAERVGRLDVHAPYTTGTVSIALATRTTVTGVDTLWNTTVTGMGFTNARAGGKMVFAGSTDVYRVTTVTNDTSITITDRFIGADALSGATYTYYEDEYALASDFDDEHGVLDAITFYENAEIEVVPSTWLYRHYPRNSTPGRIKVATIIHLGPSGTTTTSRPRVVFAPPPEALATIPYRYYTTNLTMTTAGVGQVNLSAATDELIVPLKWRMAVVWRAAEFWSRDRKDDARANEYARLYGEIIARARASTDRADNRPQIVPRIGHYALHARRPYSTAGRGRYATGTWFDEGRDLPR